MTFLSRDVVLLPESTAEYPNRWVAMNVFAHTCLGIDDNVIRFLGEVSDPKRDDNFFRCWDIERFSNEDGLLADPSRFERNVARWTELSLDRNSLIAKLKAHFILVDDETSYRARFGLKRNPFDREHFGNFHQQHGQHMMMAKRVNPAKWWMEQKFNSDGNSVRSDSLYGAVQSNFLTKYFAERIKPGMAVIDLGCGTGVYANVMAKQGATVLGVDPADEYLAVARANAVPGISFKKMQIGESGGLDTIPSASADMVFMCDALLFYYLSPYPGPKLDINVLLADIRRILKPGGVFATVEPHSAFCLAPWLGQDDRPFTVITEYLHKPYGIVPSISWWVRQFSAAGFAIADLREIGPAEYFSEVDRRAYHFANEFPLWQLLELIVCR